VSAAKMIFKENRFRVREN